MWERYVEMLASLFAPKRPKMRSKIAGGKNLPKLFVICEKYGNMSAAHTGVT